MNAVVGLSPCGESGLKSHPHPDVDGANMSLPVWGEWIEIIRGEGLAPDPIVSPRVGRVD